MIKMFMLKGKKTKKAKRKKRAATLIRTFLFLALGIGLFTLGKAITKDILVNIEIEKFKDRAIFEYEEEFLYQPGVYQTRKYYKVPRETSYEINDSRSVFYTDSRKYLGQTGDIFMSQESPFPNNFLIHQFVSYYFGGHAAIKNDTNQFIEAVGFPDQDETLLDIIMHPGEEPHDFSVTVNKTSTNYFLNPNFRAPMNPYEDAFGTYYRKKIVGLRVKDITEDQINGAVAYAEEKVNKNLYNFLFALDMDYKFYCTDLVSRAYQDVMVAEEDQRNFSRSLNDDRFITSVNDILLSDETYIAFYFEIIDDVVNIYYLEDMEG